MASVNKVMILGNVTRDIELRATPKGTSVVDLGIACNRVRTGEDGQKIEEVTYVDVTLWGRTAEIANQYLAKGRPVFIEGRLHMDTWVDQQSGKNRSRLKVVGENMQLLPSGGGGGGGAPQQQQQAPQQQQQAPQQGGSPAAPMPDFQNTDDDIPF